MTNDANGDGAYARMNGEIETGARYLATARVDVIAYGCTTGSFYRGRGWDREMLALIEREAGVPAVATPPAGGTPPPAVRGPRDPLAHAAPPRAHRPATPLT